MGRVLVLVTFRGQQLEYAIAGLQRLSAAGPQIIDCCIAPAPAPALALSFELQAAQKSDPAACRHVLGEDVVMAFVIVVAAASVDTMKEANKLLYSVIILTKSEYLFNGHLKLRG